MKKDHLMSLKYLLILTVPIFIELLLQLVVGYSDQFMMKKYENAVNGITNANVINNMIINAFTVFSSAAIILITQYKGAKDETHERSVYSVAFYFNFIVSLFFSLIILGLSRFFLKWLQVPELSYNDALLYLMITGGLLFFQTMSTTLSSLLKANSCMKESMVINLIVNLINILGNYFLIKVFAKIDLPILGVAISSAGSRIIGFILMLIIYIKKVGIPLSVKVFKSEMGQTGIKLLKLGAPSGGESVSYNSSQIIIQLCANQIVKYNGNNIGMGNIKTYASMFAMVTYMFTSAISQAMQVIIGELLGAGRTVDTNKKVKQTALISLCASTTIAILFFILSNYAFKIFDVYDPELLALGHKIMFVEIFLEIGRAFNIVFVRSLQTSGDVMFPTILAIIFCWVVAVFGSFLFGSYTFLGLGLVGIWISMAIDECSRAVIFIFRWRSGKWKKYNLVSNN